MKYVSWHLEKEACPVKTISSLEFGNDSFEAAVHNAPHCPAAVGVPGQRRNNITDRPADAPKSGSFDVIAENTRSRKILRTSPASIVIT
jgi:hypothetical protein